MSAVLVTGGAGFLGAAVVRRLVARGERVVALDNFQAGAPRNLEGLGAGVRLVAGDVTDLGGLLQLVKVEKVRRVVHAAAIVGVVSALAAPSLVTRVNMRALDIARARTVLGYAPRYDLRRGLEAYVDWYRRGQPSVTA